MKLSQHMVDALITITQKTDRGILPFLKVFLPKKPADLGLSDPENPLSSRTLFALYRRGLVAFDLSVRLTPKGRQVIADNPRRTPGDRSRIKLVSNG